MEIFRPYSFDKTLFVTTLILIIFGLIMVFSSSGVLASEKYNQPFYFLFHQLIGVGIGLFIILVMLSVRTPFYQNSLFIFGLLFLNFLFLLSCLLIPSFAQTNRWIQLFGFHFQPSELAKISLILFIAFLADRKKEKFHEAPHFLFPLSILFVFILLIIREPDYGTAFLILSIGAIMFFIGGVKYKYFIFLGIGTAGLFLFYLVQSPYRMNRILAFISPYKDPLGKGFQVIQSKLAVGAGGIFGVSIGESVQKLFFLPCAHTDYIFAIIGEELGLMGTLAILILFLLLLWRGLAISLKAPDSFSQMVSAGLILAIFFQAMLNISVVLGLSPPTGFPLPLISFGRSSLICTLFGIGILLHISQRKRTPGRKK
ncbi:cell division protein FtsW [bacterium]|nr:cell division protein FtsW [bacterium]